MRMSYRTLQGLSRQDTHIESLAGPHGFTPDRKGLCFCVALAGPARLTTFFFFLIIYFIFGCSGSLLLNGLFSVMNRATLVAVHRLLVAEASLVAEHSL